MPNSKLTVQVNSLPSRPKSSEWNLAAREQVTAIRSLRWKLRYLNVWAVGILIGLILLIVKTPTLAAALVPLWAVICARMFYRSKPKATVLELKDPSSPISAFPVELALTWNRHLYGEDHGVVSFVDGWLVYEGEDCSFAIKPCDVECKGSADSQGYITMEWGERSIVFRPNGSGNQPGKETKWLSPFVLALNEWLSYPATVMGESRFPPVMPHPATLALAKLGQQLGFWVYGGVPVVCAFALYFTGNILFALGIMIPGGLGGLAILNRRGNRVSSLKAMCDCIDREL